MKKKKYKYIINKKKSLPNLIFLQNKIQRKQTLFLHKKLLLYQTMMCEKRNFVFELCKTVSNSRHLQKCLVNQHQYITLK